jgi:hypothetical protein
LKEQLRDELPKVLFKVWSWCLRKAAHADQWTATKTGRGNTIVRLAKGQFIFGRRSAGIELRMHPETVRKRITVLQRLGLISTTQVPPKYQTSTRQITILTICNYDTYRNPETNILSTPLQSTTQVPPKYQTSTTQNASVTSDIASTCENSQAACAPPSTTQPENLKEKEREEKESKTKKEKREKEKEPPLVPLKLESENALRKTPKTKEARIKAALADPRFQKFWVTHPRHVGKQGAAWAWAQLSVANDMDDILERSLTTIAWQKQSRQWLEGSDHIPHPATYLRQRRFEDEPPSDLVDDPRVGFLEVSDELLEASQREAARRLAK